MGISVTELLLKTLWPFLLNKKDWLKANVCASEGEDIAGTHGLIEPDEKLMETGTLG